MGEGPLICISVNTVTSPSLSVIKTLYFPGHSSLTESVPSPFKGGTFGNHSYVNGPIPPVTVKFIFPLHAHVASVGLDTTDIPDNS